MRRRSRLQQLPVVKHPAVRAAFPNAEIKAIRETEK